MSVGSIIAISVVILIVGAIYLLYLVSYIMTSKRYRSAQRSDAVVAEILDEVHMATGMSKSCTKIERKFGNYLVTFQTDNGEVTMQTSVKKRNVKVGDHIEVRYDVNEAGEIKIISESFLCWLRQMAIGYTSGLILGIILAICEYEGLI